MCYEADLLAWVLVHWYDPSVLHYKRCFRKSCWWTHPACSPAHIHLNISCFGNRICCCETVYNNYLRYIGMDTFQYWKSFTPLSAIKCNLIFRFQLWASPHIIYFLLTQNGLWIILSKKRNRKGIWVKNVDGWKRGHRVSRAKTNRRNHEVNWINMKRWQEGRSQDRKKMDVQEVSGEMLGEQKRWRMAHTQMNNWSES